MPTPFQHLVYAKTVLESALLPDNISAHLQAHVDAYLFGNTAVDVQSITGQARAETHFYHIYQENPDRAGGVLLATYPELVSPYRLSPAHAAFVSGYVAHLVWDEVWLWTVFRPVYLESELWPDRLTRNVHHNALRVLADRQAEAELRAWPDLLPLLRSVQPGDWLPFVETRALYRWRDWLVTQLADAKAVQTAQVFADRMGVSTEHLEGVAHAVALDTYKPSVPGLRAAIENFESRAYADSIAALIQYWS
jgi:hypothetical protein